MQGMAGASPRKFYGRNLFKFGRNLGKIKTLHPQKHIRFTAMTGTTYERAGWLSTQFL